MHIFVIKDYILFLTEKWQNWVFLEENEDLINYKLKQKKENLATARDKGKLSSLRSTGGANEMRLFCEKINSQLFDMVAGIKVQMISNIFIHDGKDPSVEVKCFKGRHSIQLLFPGDFERQQFIEKVYRVQHNDDLSSSEEEETYKPKDDESDDNDGQVS